METILSSGLFWGALCAAIAGIGIYFTNKYVDKKQTPAH